MLLLSILRPLILELLLLSVLTYTTKETTKRDGGATSPADEVHHAMMLRYLWQLQLPTEGLVLFPHINHLLLRGLCGHGTQTHTHTHTVAMELQLVICTGSSTDEFVSPLPKLRGCPPPATFPPIPTPPPRNRPGPHFVLFMRAFAYLFRSCSEMSTTSSYEVCSQTAI